MKHLLLCLGAALLLPGCARVLVTDTQTAAVVTERPRVIYIQPFSVEGAEFIGQHEGGPGERPIRQSLAPAEFGIALKEELELLAPTRVLLPDEVATEGWLVTGTIDLVDAGSKKGRGLGFFPAINPVGKTRVMIHVKVLDLGVAPLDPDAKDASKGRRRGQVIYEFDVAGGSRLTGARGSVTAPGWGPGAPFLYRGAAERIRVALEPDYMRYGVRSSTSIR